jgi:hypothetical protein
MLPITSLTLALLFVAVPGSTGQASTGVSAHYLYSLSNFNGAIPYDRPRVFVDRSRSDLYVLSMNSIGIYNDAGMETARISIDTDAQMLVDFVVDVQGDIVALAYRGSRYEMIRCSYRGTDCASFGLSGLPGDFGPFSPNRLVMRNGKVYLADTSGMRIAVADERGAVQQTYDLIGALQMKEKERRDTGIVGFDVDQAGNMLFTIPVLFSAYRLSPDGKASSFGQPGSTPGKFNIVGGIAADNRGNILVTDVLKCAVMVFDSSFNFVAQFGSRGQRPGELIGPQDIFIDGGDRVYVTQTRRQGVSVFRLAYD